ncbi:MAG TPA: NADH:flavin oxidoreductase [Syntrophomonadaceae bacterium]|nr:NADH:flavin oxidoreductase [Syntrophomonadaceae bacterium]
MSDLWSSISLKGLYLKNRLVMPPMALDIASESGEVTEKIIEHYRSRAKMGDAKQSPGLIIVEHTYVSPEGIAHPNQLGIYDDFLIPGLQRLVEAIHETGVPVGIQLSHAGARGLKQSQGPSSIPLPFLKRFNRGGDSENAQKINIPTQLENEDISKIVKDFAQGAERAQKAGFDMIDIHGAHGYLLNQFFSPLTNHRSDGYGGHLYNRMRFPLEVFAAIRTTVGADYPIFYRLGADDRISGGNTIEDGIKAAVILEKSGVDCLDLSGGVGGYIKNGPEGFFSYMAEAVKEHTSLPVLLTGGIKTGHFANQLVSKGHADLVGVGRAILADPTWVNRAWLETGNF